MNCSLIAAVFACSVLISDGMAETVPAAYTAKCQMCHGATGLGDTPAGKAMGTPSLKSPDVIKQSDADLLGAIKNGKAKMPAFAGKLKEAEMTTLVAYIRKLQ